MIVKFTAADRELALDCSKRLVDRANRLRAEDRFGKREVRSGYIGMLGEIAFARYIGVPWDCDLHGTGGRPDVGGYEVRSVAPGAREVALKAKKNDRPGTPVVLVLVVAGRDAANEIVGEAAGVIVGFLTAEEIRKLGKWRDPGKRGAPAWFLEDLLALRPVLR